jgi:hypothetical protein
MTYKQDRNGSIHKRKYMQEDVTYAENFCVIRQADEWAEGKRLLVGASRVRADFSQASR